MKNFNQQSTNSFSQLLTGGGDMATNTDVNIRDKLADVTIDKYTSKLEELIKLDNGDSEIDTNKNALINKTNETSPGEKLVDVYSELRDKFETVTSSSSDDESDKPSRSRADAIVDDKPSRSRADTIVDDERYTDTTDTDTDTTEEIAKARIAELEKQITEDEELLKKYKKEPGRYNRVELKTDHVRNQLQNYKTKLKQARTNPTAFVKAEAEFEAKANAATLTTTVQDEAATKASAATISAEAEIKDDVAAKDEQIIISKKTWYEIIQEQSIFHTLFTQKSKETREIINPIETSRIITDCLKIGFVGSLIIAQQLLL